MLHSWRHRLLLSPKNSRIMWAQHSPHSKHSSVWGWSLDQWSVECSTLSAAISCHLSHSDCFYSQLQSWRCAFYPRTTMAANRDIRMVSHARCASMNSNELNGIWIWLFSASISSLLRAPGVLVCAMSIMATSASIGFLGATLEPHLRQFNLSPVLLGKFDSVTIMNKLNSISFWFRCCLHHKWWILRTDSTNLGMAGWQMVESKSVSIDWQPPHYGCVLFDWPRVIFAHWIVSIAFLSVKNSNRNENIVKHSQEISNGSFRSDMPWFWHCRRIGCQFHRCTEDINVSEVTPTKIPFYLSPVSISFPNSKNGSPDNIETYGLVSGLWTSTFALGAFVGPSVSGLLYDSIGFREAVIFVVVLHAIVALIGFISILCDRTPQPYKEVTASEPLLKRQDSLFFNDKP